MGTTIRSPTEVLISFKVNLFPTQTRRTGKMKPITDSINEFFPDMLSAPPVVESEQLTVLQTVAPKARFVEYATALTEALFIEQSALQAYVRIRNVADILDVALARIKEQAIASMQEATANVLGARVQLKDLPKRFEYHDTVLAELDSQKAAIDEKLKARKKFLETLTSEVVDPTTGEIIQPAKCTSAGCTLQITF